METNLSSRTLARPRKLPLAAFFFPHLKMQTEYKHVFGQSQRQPSMNRCIIDDERDCATVDLLLSNFAEHAMFVRWVHEQEVRFFFFLSPSESPSPVGRRLRALLRAELNEIQLALFKKCKASAGALWQRGADFALRVRSRVRGFLQGQVPAFDWQSVGARLRASLISVERSIQLVECTHQEDVSVT